MAVKHQQGSPYDLIIIDPDGDECEDVEVTDETIAACQQWCARTGFYGTWDEGRFFFWSKSCNSFVTEAPDRVRVIGGSGMFMYRRRHPEKFG